ncbi:MAG: alpha/beta hydrolase [Planctomycetota bacterium]
MLTCHKSFVILLAILTFAKITSAQSDVAIDWQPHTGQGHDGRPLEGRLGRIRVPENRSKPDSGTIEIAFVVYPATGEKPGPPIFYLAGGPGGSGVRLAGQEATHPALSLLDHGDVIGIDQRGTGLCQPDLQTPDFRWSLPSERPITREDLIAAHGQAVAECFQYWTDQGVDLAAYNTSESAHDLEAVRLALGLDKVVLYGASYGSHLGMTYLRLHEDHVARAVFSRLEGLNDTWKLPSEVQRKLTLLSQRIAESPDIGKKVPDLAGLLSSLLAQLEKEPVRVALDRPGLPKELVIGPLDLQLLTAYTLGSSRSLGGLPAALYYMSQGQWAPMAPIFLANRRGDIQSAMSVMMDCASGAGEERRKRIERERLNPKNVLSDALNAPAYPETCSSCGSPDLGDSFRVRFRSEVPILFVSGDLDARTPPSNVEAVREDFPNHTHLLIENATHDARELESAEYAAELRQFLIGESIESRAISLPPIPFGPVRGD